MKCIFFFRSTFISSCSFSSEPIEFTIDDFEWWHNCNRHTIESQTSPYIAFSRFGPSVWYIKWQWIMPKMVQRHRFWRCATKTKIPTNAIAPENISRFMSHIVQYMLYRFQLLVRSQSIAIDVPTMAKC